MHEVLQQFIESVIAYWILFFEINSFPIGIFVGVFLTLILLTIIGDT
jgi:hypothetical protein